MDRRNRKTTKNHDIPNKKFKLSAAVIAAAVMTAAIAMGGYLGCKEAATNEIIPENTFVDGIDVGKMTKTAAVAALESDSAQRLSGLSFNVKCGSYAESWTSEELGISTNAEEVIGEAIALGRIESPDDIFKLLSGKAEGEYYTEAAIDMMKLNEKLSAFAENYRTDPKDAQVSYDAGSDRFTYTAESSGRKTDPELIADEIKKQFAAGQTAITVNAGSETVYPAVTEAELKQNTALIGECTTTVTDNADRNTNIQLMCDAVNGLELKPGEILSINELVGERTEEKGFKEASAIIDGRDIVDQVGGGICQLAGTLYNAALSADMEIVERIHHSLPSAYLPLGLDATLNWDDKDLKIKNSKDYPVYIYAQLSDDELNVKLYGQPLEDEMYIELRSEVIKEFPPGAAEIILTPTLEPDATEVKSAAHTGYEVRVYKDYYKDGLLLRSEEVSHDTYEAKHAILLVGAPAGKE